MKKIYLLLLLCLLGTRGFSRLYYSGRYGGDMTQDSTWCIYPTGVCLNPILPGVVTDTWVVETPLFLPPGGKFHVKGSLLFRYGQSVLRMGTQPDTMQIDSNLIFPAPSSGGPGFITSVSGAGPLFLSVGLLGGNFFMDGSSFITDSSSSGTTINIYHNLYMLGTSFISSDSTGPVSIFFTGQNNAQTISWTSTGAWKYGRLQIDALDTVALLSYVPLADSPAGPGEVLKGELICNTFEFFGNGDGSQTFHIDPGASIYMANTGGIDSSIKYCVDDFSKTANYIFNGISPQITGVTLPDSIYASGSVTIDNPAGVLLSKKLHFGDDPIAGPAVPALNLELGVFTIGVADSILSMNQSDVNVDTGTFSSAPTYRQAGVVVTYESLGDNALTVTTGYELLPTTPLGIAETIVNKSNATITLGSSFTTGAMSINAGVLDASVSNYNITLSNFGTAAAQWSNNAGLYSFVPELGTVTITGNVPESNFIGSFPTTFFNVTLNDRPGAALGVDEFVNGTLTLDNGVLYTEGNNLFFGPSATPVAGTFSDTTMIAMWYVGSGQVLKAYTADGNYFFPIGDTATYSPIDLNFSGSGGYGIGAYAGVTVHNQKDPHNTDTDNYINRYWTVTTQMITAPSYSVTATYVPADVVGTEGDIAAAKYNGTLPWTKYGVTDVSTHTLSTGFVLDSIADFTGLDSAGPGVTVSDDTTICIGGFDTLQVVSVVGDTPFVYTWAPATGLSATTGTVVVASPTVTTTYTCTVTDANGTSGTDTVMVTVNPAPTLISGTNNGPICSDSTLTLIANGPVNVTGYLWQGPVVITDSTSDTATVPLATPAATGIYTITVNDGIGWGCTAVYYDTAVVDTLPDTTVVTGGGIYCDSNTIFAFNPGADIVYFEDTNSGGTSTDVPATSMLITTPGTYTYYFRAQSTLGCWGVPGSATVTINSLPLPDTAYGGGTFCDSTMISSSNGDSGTIYFQGTVSGGTSITMGGTPQRITASGIYYFRARSAAGCWGQEASDTVIINPTPAPVTASGAGTFCGADTISATGGAGGTIYFQFDTSLGMDSLLGGTPEVVDSSGTYYFRSEAAGCWSKQDSVIVFINPLPATVIISTNEGATAFCDSTTIFASNGGDGIIYYEDTMTNSFSTAMAEASAFLDSENTSYYYHFRAQNSLTGCWSNDTSVQITINALPDTVNASSISGVGPYCGSTVITGTEVSSDATIIVYFESTAPGGTSTGFGFPTALNYTVDTSGTYYFRAQNVSGCWSREGVSDDSVTVHINPLPPMHNVTGGGSMCAGGTGFHLGLDGSDTGIKYQLYNDTVTVGPVISGTGLPLDFGLYTAGATYYVIAINTTTGCNDTTTSSALINVNPLPLLSNVDTIAPGNGGPYCLGGTGSDVGINFGQNFITYLVYIDGVLDTTEPGFGGPLDLGLFTDTGTYTVVAQSDSGCTTNMLDSAFISTYPLPTAYTVSGGGTMCAGDTGYHVFLSNSQFGLQYQLYNATTLVSTLIGTGHSLDFGLQTVAGVYTVVATNSTTTCVNNMAGSATLIVNPQPADWPVTGGGSYCSGAGGLPVGLIGSEGDTISYQLYYGTAHDGSAILGTGGAFNFPPQTLAGTYSIVATNINTGCVWDILENATISINPLPAIYTLFGGGSYCAGGVGFNVGLSGSQAGITYYLYNDGILVDSTDGTGALDSFGHKTAAGTYTVVAQNSLTTCVSNMLGAVTIAINTLPLIDTVRGSGSYCSGGAGVMIGLSGSTIGIDYQLSRAGSFVGGPVAGTNSPLNFGVYPLAGVYKVSATNVVTGCLSNMVDSAIVSINPLPAVYVLSGGGSYCAGDSGVVIGLSGSDIGVNYQLYHGTVTSGSARAGVGDTLDYGVFTAPGGYSVIATNATTGCTDSMMGIPTISINPLPPVHLVVGGGIYCRGGAGVDVELSRSDDGYVYLLYNGSFTVGPPLAGTDTVLNFGPQTLAGTYWVYAIDTATTCADTMFGHATVAVDSQFIPIISVAAHPGTDVAVGARDTLVATIRNGGPDATIQWYVNGNLVPGATDDTFAFNIYYNTDSLTCQVTTHGVCGDYTASQSIFITLHNVGVSQLTGTGSELKLMPNPNKGAFTIKGTLGTTVDEEVSVEVTDMLGQTVYKDKIMATGGNIDQQIQLSSSLANGMYILNLRSAGQDNIFHFVVEQ